MITARRDDGKWTVIDASRARSGGLQMLNCIRNTGRKPDVLIHPDLNISVIRPGGLEVPTPDATVRHLSTTELLTNYTARYWNALSSNTTAAVGVSSLPR